MVSLLSVCPSYWGCEAMGFLLSKTSTEMVVNEVALVEVDGGLVVTEAKLFLQKGHRISK